MISSGGDQPGLNNTSSLVEISNPGPELGYSMSHTAGNLKGYGGGISQIIKSLTSTAQSQEAKTST